MAKRMRQYRILIAVALGLLAGGGRWMRAQTSKEAPSRCTCGSGHSLDVGAVSYCEESGRETITRIEAEPGNSDNLCRALWVDNTEIRPVGTPYEFHLERMRLNERRIGGCEDGGERFVARTTKYEFVFGEDSVSIREMRRISPAGSTPIPESNSQVYSNSTLWRSIAEAVPPGSGEDAKRASVDARRAFNRRSWILVRTDVKVHYVGIKRDAFGVQELVSLKKSRKVKAGQLAQIEAVGPTQAIVRFYDGSRIGKFGRTTKPFKRWYDRIGGPYLETNDDLYTPLRAYIVEISLDDIVEINDYLDQGNTDRT